MWQGEDDEDREDVILVAVVAVCLARPSLF